MITGFTIGIIMIIFGISLQMISLIEESTHGLLATVVIACVACGAVDGLILGIIYLAVIYK